MGRAESFPPFRPTSGELVRRCAERWGDAPFVVLGDERLTYAEADARSAALAKGMLASGVGKSTPCRAPRPQRADLGRRLAGRHPHRRARGPAQHVRPDPRARSRAAPRRRRPPAHRRVPPRPRLPRPPRGRRARPRRPAPRAPVPRVPPLPPVGVGLGVGRQPRPGVVRRRGRPRGPGSGGARRAPGRGRGRGPPVRPDDHGVLLGEHGRPQGGRPHAGRDRPPRPQPEPACATCAPTT